MLGVAPDSPRPEVIEIRRYGFRDSAETLRVFRAAVHETAVRDYTLDEVHAWAPDDIDEDAWAARRLAARTYVACVAGEVVGFSDFTDDGLLDMLFVHPRVGGRGVARALVERVVREAAAAGHVRLHTHASITARPAFERLGFVVDGARRNQVRGQVLQNYDMHVDLRSQIVR